MRSGLAYLIGIAICLAANPVRPAAAQDVSDPLAAMQGRWVWIGNRDKLGLPKACAEEGTDFDVSPDRRELRYRFVAVKDGKKEERSGSYIVLYEDKGSVAMYLKGEERHLKNGDRYMWIAMFEGRDRFLWRVYGSVQSREELSGYARVRCPAR